VSLRGIAAVSETVCWVSGSEGSVYRTANGGKSWVNVSPENFDSLDFRDIEVFDDETALIVSAGYPTRILKTTDSGNSWRVVYSSDDRRIFLDAMDFWDERSGILFGDAIGRKLIILKTDDQGASWYMLDTALMPNVAMNQGGFAASGSCLQTIGDSGVIIGLGGAESTLLVSRDRGQSWQKNKAPLSAGNTSSGIFSFSFLNEFTGIVAGGDYKSDSASANSVAITHDAGTNWDLITDPAVNGFYHSSCIFLDNKTIFTFSRFGSSRSSDGGKSWQRTAEAYYSVSRFTGGFWVSGPKGKIARWRKAP
jgi:photosystem II stability/assembly factor-like uncharacterized protein